MTVNCKGSHGGGGRGGGVGHLQTDAIIQFVLTTGGVFILICLVLCLCNGVMESDMPSSPDADAGQLSQGQPTVPALRKWIGSTV